jgi:hypothetical protein
MKSQDQIEEDELSEGDSVSASNAVSDNREQSYDGEVKASKEKSLQEKAESMELDKPNSFEFEKDGYVKATN